MELTLSVAIPCYNESLTIRAVIDRVAAQELSVRQIIVVDDGSTDETFEILENTRKSWPRSPVELRVIRFPRNRGKGAAMKAAIAAASQPYFLIQDADFELDPGDYARLLEPLRSGTAVAVFGDRFSQESHRNLRWPSRLANGIVTALSNALYGLRLRDQACGYKLLPTGLAREMGLESDGFEICSEITAKLGRGRVPIASVPVRYSPRTDTQGKKIRWKDGFLAVFALLKHRL